MRLLHRGERSFFFFSFGEVIITSYGVYDASGIDVRILLRLAFRCDPPDPVRIANLTYRAKKARWGGDMKMGTGIEE
jgi:hypothetical protein